MSVALIALIGTLFGGAGLKLVEYLITKGAAKKLKEHAEQARIEKRAQEILDKQWATLTDALKVAQAEVEAAEKEMLGWREKYWKLREEHVVQLNELLTAISRIKDLEHDGNNPRNSDTS